MPEFFGSLASVIGAATGTVSLLILIYLAGVWKGGVDKDLKNLNEQTSQHPPSEMWTKINLLWEVYAVDALHDKPNLAANQSPLQITEEGIQEIPDHIRRALDVLPSCKLDEIADAQYKAIECIGMPVVKAMANSKGWSVKQTVALLGLYLQRSQNGRKQ